MHDYIRCLNVPQTLCTGRREIIFQVLVRQFCLHFGILFMFAALGI